MGYCRYFGYIIESGYGYRMLLRSAFLLLALGGSMPGPIQTLRWSANGVPYALQVDHRGLVVGHPERALRSVVGPLVATLEQHTIRDEDGARTTLRIRTERRGAYSFDLVDYLDASDQSGEVLRQLLAGETLTLGGELKTGPPSWPDRPSCPSPRAMQAWDGGLVELAQLLVASQCFDDHAVRLEPEAFWVDAWDGRQVTLAVQRDHCEADTEACTGSLAYLRMRPPQAWIGWLDAARNGRGRLYGTPSAATAAAMTAALPR